MNTKYDKIEKNMPITYDEINKLWIYEGSNEMDFTPFAGKYLNRVGKGIFLDMIYLQKVVQINKSILSAFEGNYQIYDPTKIYSEGDVVLYKDTFFVSIDDNNNKSLDDSTYWYSFKLKLNFLHMVDQETNEIYKLSIKNGQLNIDKVN